MTEKRTLGSIFSYRKSIPEELLEIMDFSSKRTSPYWVNIIEAGLNSRIDYNVEFKQDAYVNSIIRNERMSDYKEASNIKHLVDSDDEQEKYGGVSINSIDVVDLNYEQVEISDEIRHAIKDVKIMQNTLLYTDGINLRTTIESALEGIPAAVEKLKEVCTTYEILGEKIYTLLGAGVNISMALA